MPEPFDLKTFGQVLFDTMIASAKAGIAPPITFAVCRDGKTEIQMLPESMGYLLANGEAKDAIFSFWRRACADPQIEAFACGGETWEFIANERGEAFRKERSSEYMAMLDHGFTKLLAADYGERHEAFHVVAQTRESIVSMSRRFYRAGTDVRWLGDPKVVETTRLISRVARKCGVTSDLRILYSYSQQVAL